MKTEIQQASVEPAWSLWEHLGFQFSVFYWLLFLAQNLDGLPVLEWFGWPLHRLALWAGTHIFHLSGESAVWHSTGSGDTALHYVAAACAFMLSVVGAAAWGVVDKYRNGRREYHTAYAYLRLVLRFALSAAMLSYGFSKIFGIQFEKPDIYELSRTYGATSPMHLLWIFMGASRPYTIFGGLAEVISGAMLLFRRTSTVGLLSTVAVMLNVFLLNLCYDVPVKLYSGHLLLLALFLLLPDAVPLWDFLILRRRTVLDGISLATSERRSRRYVAYILQAMTIVFFCYAFGWRSYVSRPLVVAKPEVFGAWSVDQAEGFSGSSTPQKLIFDNTGYAVLIVNDAPKYLRVNYDNVGRTAQFSRTHPASTLHWEKTPDGRMTLTGTYVGQTVSLKLHKVNLQDEPLLTTRGFHWVQEYADME